MASHPHGLMERGWVTEAGHVSLGPGAPSQSSLSHSDQPVSRGFWPLASLTGQGPQGPWAPLLSEGPECGVWTGWVCVLQSPGQQRLIGGRKGSQVWPQDPTRLSGRPRARGQAGPEAHSSMGAPSEATLEI